jgi:peptide/nickel transport system permease protein
MTEKRQTHDERGRIRVTGFDSDRVTERDPLSDWTDGTSGETVGRWRRGLQRFKRNRSAMGALVIVVLMALAATFARPITVLGVVVQPFSLAPYDPTTILYLQDPAVNTYDPPSWNYPMGVDGSGRDLFSPSASSSSD